MIRTPSSPGLRWVWVGLLCLSLAGCGALRIVYGQGSTLSYWWLDRYVDFNGLQTPKVHRALERWFAWQHGQALPQVLSLLDTVQSEAEKPEVNAQRICSWWGEVLTLRDDAFRAALPSAAELARSLTPAQLRHIEARQAKSIQDYRDDFLQDDPEDRFDASVDRAKGRLELLYGKLDRPQLQQVARWLRASPFDAERWGRERQRRQGELLQSLRDIQGRPMSQPDAEAALARWWSSAVHPRSAEYQAYVNALELDNCRFAAEFHRGSSAVQKRHLRDRLAAWSEDLMPFVSGPSSRISDAGSPPALEGATRARLAP